MFKLERLLMLALLDEPCCKALLRYPPAGIRTRIGNHTFRATGITAYLKNGGTLEKAAMIANHASTRTTQLRRNDEVTLDEVERILI
jgi:integrase